MTWSLQTVQDLSEGSTVTIEGKKEDGSTYTIPLAHTFNNNQLKWFKAGSALNAVRSCWHVVWLVIKSWLSVLALAPMPDRSLVLHAHAYTAPKQMLIVRCHLCRCGRLRSELLLGAVDWLTAAPAPHSSNPEGASRVDARYALARSAHFSLGSSR